MTYVHIYIPPAKLFARKVNHRSVLPTEWQMTCARLFMAVSERTSASRVIPKIAALADRDQRTIRDLLWRADKNGALR